MVRSGDLSKLEIDKNPMIGRTKQEIEKPDLHLLKIIRDPSYLGATCKMLFNIELHPIQVAILQEFWFVLFLCLLRVVVLVNRFLWHYIAY